MSVRKRRKSTRYPGSKTHGRGRKNRTRGSGNRGGVGMSGTGKRGDQKKTLVIKLHGNDYFGKDTRGAGTRLKKRIPSLSLTSVSENMPRYLREGVARQQGKKYELDLKGYKIIGNNACGLQMNIHAKIASKGARQAVEKAGGSITTSTSTA